MFGFNQKGFLVFACKQKKIFIMNFLGDD